MNDAAAACPSAGVTDAHINVGDFPLFGVRLDAGGLGGYLAAREITPATAPARRAGTRAHPRSAPA